ncbi:FAST kinase domain-containing protein 1, mitochondrial-like [Asterias rubens]|uniref:FAST kinase domain-containing protein 1, mitochondrial-like n=1 Tax=Asterias rubens TaxID=7604 RepID=UPI00145596F1|nr:FAST kinase domain-containing protein 1, mitochondrial-like [Asterias rubens]XP_033625173.1 FAST kinase domain-containing protein 1, mitochondrial-like [Asterias rubens]XP_033625174.1 FAST kinase domain-containing protein 1, mitochondrial-like [Asterias rubens]
MASAALSYAMDACILFRCHLLELYRPVHVARWLSTQRNLTPCHSSNFNQVIRRRHTLSEIGLGNQRSTTKERPLLASHYQQRTLNRLLGMLSEDAILDQISSMTNPTEVLNLTSRLRSRLTHVHIYHAFNHIWQLSKAYSGPEHRSFIKAVRGHPEFNALCVLAENKVKEVESGLLVDTFYAAVRLMPDIFHPFVQELRTEIFYRLDELGTDGLSKLAVVLNDIRDNRSPMFGEVLRQFLAKLRQVDDIRELSAWMKEMIHLIAPDDRTLIYKKASQLLTKGNPNEIGDSSLRRIIQSLAKGRDVNMPLLNQCSQLLLQMVDGIHIKELCIIHNVLGFLNYENQELNKAIRKSIFKKLPDCQEPADLAFAMEQVGGFASANVKLLLTDKAEEVVSELKPFAISNMCAGLRMMGYRAQSPLVPKLVQRIREEVDNLQVESISSILEFLVRVDGVDPEVFIVLQKRLMTILHFAFSPGRVLNVIYCLSFLPDVDNLDPSVLKRIRSSMPQLHIAGINQVLLSTSKMARKLVKTEGLSSEFKEIRQELFDKAQASIHEITSIHFLNNIVDIILQEGGHVLVLDAAMKQFKHILHRLTPQLSVDCARNLFKARYFQRELLDAMAEVATEKIHKITPMQILYILSPYCTLNYLPPNAQDFFAACVSRCEPFLDSLPAGYLVDLTHILTFLQQFPEVFIRRIFSLDFLTKLDEELETIPDRSLMYRRKLMYLNRTVALECPELQVPWFHEQFNQDLLKKRSLSFDPSLRSVQTTLVEVLGGAQYLRSFVVSPYYYDISFECVLDSDGHPLACADYGSVLNRSGEKVANSMLADLMQWGTQTKQLPQGAQRVAIDFLPSSLFCLNSRHNLGMVVMKQRHLELMGYRYVQIPHFVWSSQALAEPVEKVEYLRQLIFFPEADKEEDLMARGSKILTGQVKAKLPRNFGIKEEGLLEDEMVLKVLHTLDRFR